MDEPTLKSTKPEHDVFEFRRGQEGVTYARKKDIAYPVVKIAGKWRHDTSNTRTFAMDLHNMHAEVRIIDRTEEPIELPEPEQPRPKRIRARA